MKTNTSAAILPPIRVRDVDSQLRDLFAATVEWAATHWLQVLVAVLAGSVIVVALHVARRAGRRLCERSSGPAGWGAVIGRAVVRTGNIFIVLLAARLVVGFAGAPLEVTRVIAFLFTIAAVFQSAIWAREIILGAIAHRTGSEHDSAEALGSAMGVIRLLVSFALFAIAFVVVLDNVGVNVTGLIAGLGVGGIAIGLAAQGVFADLFAALAIILDRPFRRGDAISYDTSSGTVEAIGLKSTRIRGVTGEERIVANKQLLEKEIINNSSRAYRRIIFTLALVRSTDSDTLDALPTMLKTVVEAAGLHYVRAGFTTFGASSYDFDVEFDSPSASFQEFYDARHTVGLAIIRRLNDAGIELAYPTQTGFTAASRPDRGPAPAPEGRTGTRAAPSTSAVDEDGGH